MAASPPACWLDLDDAFQSWQAGPDCDWRAAPLETEYLLNVTGNGIATAMVARGRASTAGEPAHRGGLARSQRAAHSLRHVASAVPASRAGGAGKRLAITDAIGRRRPYHRNPGTSQALPDGKDDCQGHQHGRENDDGERCPVRGLARGHRFPVRRSIATLRRRISI